MRKLFPLLALCLLSVASFAQDLEYERGFKARSAALIDRIADNFALTGPGINGASQSIPDPEKHHWPAVIARFEKYCETDSVGNRRINTYSNNSPFHFTLVGMARIMGKYKNSPMLVFHKKRYLDNVFARSDGYNAFTGEGTENHHTMNKTSGYLYCQYAIDAGYTYPNTQQKMADMKLYFRDFMQKLYQGGSGEWNSSTYSVYNLIGFLNLYDFAKDPEVRMIAKAVLDYYTADMALHYTQGITGGPESRGGATVSVRTDTDYLAWLWFGDNPNTTVVTGNTFFNGNQYNQAMHAASSSYRPNPIAVKLARKEIGQNTFYYNTKGDYLHNDPGLVKQQFKIGKNFTLGTAQLPYGGFAGGSTQFVSWKCVVRVDTPNTSALQLTGAGGYYTTRGGRGRQPYDQFVQHQNVMIQMTRVPTNATAIEQQITDSINAWKLRWRRDFDLRFPTDSRSDVVNMVTGNTVAKTNLSYLSYTNNTAIVSSEFQSGIFFLNMGKAYAAVRSIARTQPTNPANEGANNSRLMITDVANAGEVCGLVFEVADASDYTDYAAFKTAIINQTSMSFNTATRTVSYTSLAGDNIAATYTVDGDPATYREPLFDWGYGVTQQVNIMNSPPFVQVGWPANQPGFGRIPTYAVNNQAVPASAYKVFNGTNLTLENGILNFIDGSLSYTVNVNGTLPTFNYQGFEYAGGSIKVCNTNRINLEQNFSNTSRFSGPYIDSTTRQHMFGWPQTGIFNMIRTNNGFTDTVEVNIQQSPRDVRINLDPRTYYFCTGTNYTISASTASSNSQLRLFRDSAFVSFLGQSGSFTSSVDAEYEVWSNTGCCYNRSFPIKFVSTSTVRQPTISQNGDTLYAVTDMYNPRYRWYVNGNLLPDTTDEILRPIGGGNVTVELLTPCGNVQSLPYSLASVADEILCNCAVKVFPSPANDLLSLSIESELKGKVTYKLSDLTGREYINESAEKVQDSFNKNFNISKLPSGIYHLFIELNNNRLVRRVVKQ